MEKLRIQYTNSTGVGSTDLSNITFNLADNLLYARGKSFTGSIILSTSSDDFLLLFSNSSSFDRGYVNNVLKFTPSTGILSASEFSGKLHFSNLIGYGTESNLVIVSTGTGWKLKTLGSNAFDGGSYLPVDGTALSAFRLTTVSKTAWGQKYWTDDGVPTNISGDMTGVGSITFNPLTGSTSRDLLTLVIGNDDKFVLRCGVSDPTVDYAEFNTDTEGYVEFAVNDAGYVEFATYSVASESFLFKLYIDNVLARTATILDHTGNSIFPGIVYASTFVSTVPTGTLPYACSSTTLNTNLNADLLDGVHLLGLFTDLSNSGNNISITIGGVTKSLTPVFAASASSAATITPFTVRDSSYTTWGVLKDSSYSYVKWFNEPGGGGLGFSSKDSKLYMLIDGDYYANEGNSLVLHSDNYNNYSPTLAGGGATGTWDIDISGDASTLGGYNLSSFFRYRGVISTTYVDLSTYTANHEDYKNYENGVYIINRSGYSDMLIHFLGSGSTSGLELKTHYNNSSRIEVRKTIDSNRLSGDWLLLAWVSDIPTITDYYWANIPISSTSSLTTSPTFGVATATTFKGNLDGTYVNKLTGYTKATAIGSIATTDSLNTALGKLEFKTDFIYNDLFGTDNDDVINKWSEIVDFIDSVAEGTDITEEFVTRKTNQTITGAKTFKGTSGSILTVDRNSTNPAWIKFCKNGTLQGYIGITNDFQPVFLSGESGASNKILIHAGNYSSYLGYIGTTAVQASSAALALTGITNLTMNGTYTNNNKLIIHSSGCIYPYSTSTRTAGMYGKYDSTKVSHVWSMGTEFKIADDGSSTNNMYGLVYFHTNWSNSATNNATKRDDALITEVSNYAGGHQIAFVVKGQVKASLGDRIWARAGFLKSGSSDSYVLLGGGGHKALSDFATASGVVTALGTNGNYVTWTKNGTINNLTVPYATSAGAASKLTTVSKTAWGLTYWTSGGIPTSIDGNMTSVGSITFSTLTDTEERNLLVLTMGTNDKFVLKCGATAANAGYVEFATYDDATEPFYFRQYLGTTLKRTATILDGSGNTSFPGTVTSTGFAKSDSSDDYVLLGGGGHQTLSSITASKLNSTTIVNNEEISLVNTGWTDTGYKFTNLATGTYAIQVTFGTTLVASGIMSVYKNLEDTVGDEIPLHVYGTAPWRPYLRTHLNRLEISSNDISNISRTVTIKIALIL